LGCGGSGGTQQQEDVHQAAYCHLSRATMPIARGAGLHSNHGSTPALQALSLEILAADLLCATANKLTVK
jgi:hypothetical protein